MKFSGFWVFFLFFLVTSTAILSVSACAIYGFSMLDHSNPKILCTEYGESGAIITTSRKMKENEHGTRSKAMSGTDIIALNDYHPIDPVPSSKASIKPGPIEHSTSLQPYLPRPSPPSHPEIPLAKDKEGAGMGLNTAWAEHEHLGK